MKRRSVLTAAVLVLAALFIAVGIIKKEPQGVLAKAAAICLECIGIG